MSVGFSEGMFMAICLVWRFRILYKFGICKMDFRNGCYSNVSTYKISKFVVLELVSCKIQDRFGMYFEVLKKPFHIGPKFITTKSLAQMALDCFPVAFLVGGI